MTDVAEAEAPTEASAPTIPPWDQLRQAREQHSLTQAEVARELKLDLRYVKALEEGKLDDLPEPVYTAGYVRAYAKLVGLPADEIVSSYASQESTSMPEITQVREREKIPSRYRHVDNALPKSFSVSHHSYSEKKPMKLLIIGLAVLVFAAIVWQVATNMEKPQPTPLQEEATNDLSAPASQPEQQQVAPVDETETTTVDLPLPGQSSDSKDAAGQTGGNGGTASLQDNARKMAEITLSYSEDSWVDIRDATGKALIRRLGKAGNSQTVEGVPPFNVVLGYTPGVKLEYNGEPYDLASHHRGPVARFVLQKPSGEQ
jgi:cytoskeleton protein RodZ